MDQPLALEDRRKAPADGFDFRQFRHGVCVAWSGQRSNRAAGPTAGIARSRFPAGSWRSKSPT
jgi:hypothetical protein